MFLVALIVKQVLMKLKRSRNVGINEGIDKTKISNDRINQSKHKVNKMYDQINFVDKMKCHI